MDNLEPRINAIPWQEYTHPCFAGSFFSRLPRLFLMLSDDDSSVSGKAALDLSDIICHQGAVGSVAVPSLPFLFERIESNPPIAVLQELMEMMYWFSRNLEPPDTSTWTPEARENAKRCYSSPDDYQWTYVIRKLMCQKLHLFEQFGKHDDEQVAGDAERALENLRAFCNAKT